MISIVNGIKIIMNLQILQRKGNCFLQSAVIHTEVPCFKMYTQFFQSCRLSSVKVWRRHYENLSMQYTEIFSSVKIKNFQWKIVDIFFIFAQNIYCRYTLEPPRRGGSNEYPQSMFWSKNKKNRYTLAYPSFAI